MEVFNRALDASFDVDLVFDWLHREQTNALCWTVPSAMLLIDTLICSLDFINCSTNDFGLFRSDKLLL